jgi:methylenetetrahydrofolate--tRNA-(uracil-5-)-methyltransferase
MQKKIRIIGGGLAGSEAALQFAKRGWQVDLYEMRPKRMTPAHSTDKLGELVCSNSLKSSLLTTASGLLKAELRLLGSELLKIADEVRVPAGNALAVDRDLFSEKVTERILQESMIKVHNE